MVINGVHVLLRYNLRLVIILQHFGDFHFVFLIFFLIIIFYYLLLYWHISRSLWYHRPTPIIVNIIPYLNTVTFLIVLSLNHWLLFGMLRAFWLRLQTSVVAGFAATKWGALVLAEGIALCNVVFVVCVRGVFSFFIWWMLTFGFSASSAFFIFIHIVSKVIFRFN